MTYYKRFDFKITNNDLKYGIEGKKLTFASSHC